MCKTPQCRTTSGNLDVEKVHAVVARSTFRRQNVQNTPVPDHFWKLRRLPSFLQMLQNRHVLLTFDKVHNPVCREMASERQKVVRACGVLYILTSKCASRHNGVHFFDIATSKSGLNLVGFVHFGLKMVSRHNGVQFFISHLPSWLRTRRFSEPTFRPCGASNHLKNRMFHDFPTFSRTWIFFLLRLSLF